MMADIIQADEFDEVLVTGFKYPYTESRIAKTPKQVHELKRELKQIGCMKVRVLQAQKMHAAEDAQEIISTAAVDLQVIS